MLASLLDVLVDPDSREPLVADAREHHGPEIVSGRLVGPHVQYPIRDGIPRFVHNDESEQAQTRDSFGYKWTNERSFGSEGMKAELHRWLLERYGFSSSAEMRAYFAARRRTLDAGCGAGFATSAWMDASWNADTGAEWIGADISAAIDVARRRLGHFPGTQFVQADVLRLPFRERTFDSIFSEGVLHHTPSTDRAFKSLIPLLADGGDLMIYVYRKKAPIREFTDDYVRGLISGLPPEEAWNALRPLTRLGRSLAQLGAQVVVEEDVPLLGIRAGTYDVQRLIYWHVAKLFWNDAMTFEENNHLNFDWYHPRFAHRHTEDEVRRWYAESGLQITHLHVDDAGYTVRGTRS